jgi:hypothetical protein
MGVAAFTTPDVQRILKLTTAQNKRLGEIAGRWDRTLEMARRSGAAAETLRKLTLQAENEALGVLSPAQQKRWQEVLELAGRSES